MGSGAIGELVYKLGDMREHEFSGLTQATRPDRPRSAPLIIQ